jgi:polygalacturonase
MQKFSRLTIWTIFFIINVIIFFNYNYFFLKIIKPTNNLDALPFVLPNKTLLTSPTNICNIKDFGAVSNSPEKATTNRKAIQKAIDSCVNSNHALFVPPGIWFTGGLYFNKDNSWIVLDSKATLSFVYNPELYLPLHPSRFEGYGLMNFSAPLYFDNVSNGGIIGEGKITIEEPEEWHKWDKKEKPSKKLLFKYSKKGIPLEKRIFGNKNEGLRRPFLQLYKTKNFVLSDINIQHSTMWTVHVLYSDNLLIQNLNIFTDGPNTDGIVIDSSTNIVIKNNTLSTGDDAIVLKSGSDYDGRRIARPTKKVFIEDIMVNNAHGAIVIGSEMSGGVKDIVVKNIRISKADIGLRIKTRPNRGGYVQNVNLDGLQAEELTDELIKINSHYREAIGKVKKSSALYPKIENIHLKNATTKITDKAIFIDGLKESPIKNLSLINITASQQKHSKILNAPNPQLQNINITFPEQLKSTNPMIWSKFTDTFVKKLTP